ncbi:MAG: spore coat protein [Lachnospiraceae bacterium]|nr:spore coat protein [Lachnospiraceae bacterium]
MYTEKEVLNDGLCAVKTATEHYNTFSNECAHENVRSTVLNLLNDEHTIQNDIFQMMSSRGLYPTPAAEDKKIQEAKQKFAPGAGM